MATQVLKRATDVAGGLWSYYTGGSASPKARQSLLELHCETNGRSTDLVAKVVRLARPPHRVARVQGFLGNLTPADQYRIREAIVRDGFYNFGARVPAEISDAINEYALRTPCTVEGRSQAPEDRICFDPAASPISKTYRIPEKECVTDPVVQRLMADPSMLAIAETYLRTHPILSGANIWWSATHGDKPGADAAQEFHFDFDPPPIWLLFFVYLTDVGPENGPHVFVRGSHVAGHPAAAPLLSRGYVRIPDEDVAAAYGKENVVELCGTRGTILAVDTRGFHKGKMLTAGHRLMLQLTYSCPPYSGAHFRKQPIRSDIDPALAAAMAKTPRVYERYR